MDIADLEGGNQKRKPSYRRTRRECRDRTGKIAIAFLGALGDLGDKSSCLSTRNFLRAMEDFQRCRLFLRPPLRAVLIRRRNECAEQRMRLQRLRLELRMKLASDEMWMVEQFDHLDVGAIRRRAGDAHSRRD